MKTFEPGTVVYAPATVTAENEGSLVLIELGDGGRCRTYADPDRLVWAVPDSQLSPADFAELWRLVHRYGATRRDLVLSGAVLSGAVLPLPAPRPPHEDALVALSEFVSGLLDAWHEAHGGHSYCDSSEVSR
jgi:hypothetical protein